MLFQIIYTTLSHVGIHLYQSVLPIVVFCCWIASRSLRVRTYCRGSVLSYVTSYGAAIYKITSNMNKYRHTYLKRVHRWLKATLKQTS